MTKQHLSKNHLVTIYDVARESGVSYSTVSRVLNGFEFVKDGTRQKVLEAAEKLGYVANLQARSLAGGRSSVIGVLVPGIDNSYITEIVAGIDDELAKANFNLMLHTTHRHSGKEAQYVNMIANGMSDGILLVVPLAIEAYLSSLRDRQFPYVLIDQHDSLGKSAEIVTTNRQGAYEAVSYLIELGHRRIAFITGLMELYSTYERLAGYKDALADHNIPVIEDYIVEGDFWEKEAYIATNKLLSLDPLPTAIFASNDLTALGAMVSIREHGLSIPEDISIIGFDDIPQAAYVHPTLTTVRQPLVQMGRAAVNLLLETLDNSDLPPRQVMLDTELIIRDSCQPPRSIHG
jgi:LacI family transcriptional regulator